MNFEEWYNHDFGEADYYMKQKNMSSWNACKKEVLKIIEDEIDNGKMSIAAAAKKIREL